MKKAILLSDPEKGVHKFKDFGELCEAYGFSDVTRKELQAAFFEDEKKGQAFAKRSERKYFDAYEEVEKILRDWCDKNYYTTLIVRLKLDGEIETVIVEWDEDLTCCFNWDFYEGQENIELIGFSPAHIVPIKIECNIIISGVKE